ncbi:MAG: Fic family protein [Candidatus Pacebacteria bacterium]|nr:Fic family protein [Candidatus Paceibacterota bacterium]
MKMIQLDERQKKVLEFISKNPGVQNKDILNYLRGNISRATIVRDLVSLYENDLIERKGEGRNVGYFEKISSSLLSFIDPNKYFEKDPDERKLLSKSFNFEIFKKLNNLFSEQELDELDKLNNSYRKRIKKLSPAILKREWERMIIELSWKSSKIEGNTYNLIDTEILIKENIEAKGHKKEEAIMILNHKKALDYILESKDDFKKINWRDIENIHSLLIQNLGVKKGIRRNAVGILGTNYKPFDNQYQIKEALEKMVELVNKTKHPIEKALIIGLVLPYIQPFEDGNKRTSRISANAILLAHDYSLLSFRSINEVDYKKALILFYEQNNARLFKELFVEQFKFSITNYFCR